MDRRTWTVVATAVALAVPTRARPQGARDPLHLPSGDRDNGTHAATLLEMAISPRGVALGEAMGAIGGDPTSIWYNAAGIALIRTNSFLITGSQRFADTQLAGAAVTLPTALGTFGIGARAFNAGTIDVTENSLPLGRLRAYQLALEAGGAIQITRHWLWGGSLFYAQETLGDDARGSVGVNSGMMFPDIYGRLTLGAGFRNWGTPVTFDAESARPPLVGYAAGSLDLLRHRNMLATPRLFRGEPLVLDAKATAQADLPDQGEVIGRFGIEGTLNGVAIARIGYQLGDDNRRGLSLGAGINVGPFRLEYAFRNRRNGGANFFADDVIGDEHHVAATLFWGRGETNVPRTPPLVPRQPAPGGRQPPDASSKVDGDSASVAFPPDSARSSRFPEAGGQGHAPSPANGGNAPRPRPRPPGDWIVLSQASRGCHCVLA